MHFLFLLKYIPSQADSQEFKTTQKNYRNNKLENVIINMRISSYLLLLFTRKPISRQRPVLLSNRSVSSSENLQFQSDSADPSRTQG
jgi:hypothetical protein